ncbi:hypothetical protein [Cutibacterium avidum]|uniref:Tail assembly chaperone n=1 Tax=Cutibacterium avidum TaxID=33010 RepID=A0A3E2DNI6_9ACTN|nr:hypothetical protein [Cutibacterium avidum]MDU3568429.1 hypothetical protein [Cutibacterium avidum]RFT46513.1 hypothetical protein CHT91_02935 [Cutibacterium avidum]TMT54745.1 hypothetical protein DMY01_02995 [Cutibacterium avidum]
MADGYTLTIGGQSWTLAPAEQVVEKAPAKIFRRAARIAESGDDMDLGQIEVMFSLLAVAAPTEAIDALEELPMVEVAERFRQWMEYKPDDGDGEPSESLGK